MPELPEVHTTATILNNLIKGRKIVSVWTDYNSPYYYGKENIKDPKYFRFFKAEVEGAEIVGVGRRAKNVLIEIKQGASDENRTILIHMKMTGQLLYGKYKKTPRAQFKWVAADDGPLKNSFSRFIHLVFELDNGMHLTFSDMRKFGTVKLIRSAAMLDEEFSKLGPEPLEPGFTFKIFKEKVSSKKTGAIKTVLMNPEIISGVGNIYSDEILFESSVLPTRKVSSLSEIELKTIYKNIKRILKKGINLGGDSMSDYRNPYGEKGEFQLCHKVYGRKNQPCKNRGCDSKIKRVVIDGRSAHFCPVCQG